MPRLARHRPLVVPTRHRSLLDLVPALRRRAARRDRASTRRRPRIAPAQAARKYARYSEGHVLKTKSLRRRISAAAVAQDHAPQISSHTAPEAGPSRGVVCARAPSPRWWCAASSHGLRTRRVQATAAVTHAIRPRATCAARRKAALDDRVLHMVHCAWRCAHACVPRSVPLPVC